MPTTKISPRMERIASAILHEIGKVLTNELEDKRLKHAQLSRVIVSKDLSHAKVYFTVADPAIDVKQLAKLLDKVSTLFRHHIASALDLRVTPEIKFYFDEQAAKTTHLLSLIEKL